MSPLLRRQSRLLIVTILMVASVLITYYFHAVLKSGAVFTHFFYIPVILSALWWQRRGLIVALILSAYLLISHYFFGGDEVTLNDYLRVLSFLVISAVVGLLSERLWRTELVLKKAQEELEQKVEERTRELMKINEKLRSEVENRQKAEAALRESSEKVKMFAYSVCHDLKSPAIAIYGLTRLLKERCAHLLDVKGTAHFDQILKASLELETLVEAINAYINTKEALMQFETVKADELLREISKAFEEQFLTRGIQCYLGRNGAVLRADRIALIRAFRNLVGCVSRVRDTNVRQPLMKGDYDEYL
ncbi:membrane hypothetical protein [uncultured Desulfobacterium sp.]|uniref:histidine kinase n=1 Tax=uncultured Desulfobacterium sp. TaxID=201089 RepID=A0A445N3T0_9BACT|nr:membrane hypothetical protein [uncultured Desulfobacterium sp.]